MDCEIVKLTTDMTEECVDLYMQTYSKEPWFEKWESREPVVNFYRNHFANNYFLGFAAVSSGKIIAVSAGFLKPWIGGMEYYIDDFFVGYDYQGQGIGKWFMAAIKGELILQGIAAIMLNTERAYPAYEFYIKTGFVPDERTVVLYASF